MKKTNNKTDTIIKNEDGAAAIEFALVSVVFLMFLFSIFETGRMFLYWNSFQYAVEDSLRHVMVSKNNDKTLTNDEIKDYIKSRMSNFSVLGNDIDVTISGPYELSGVSFMDINGTLDFEAYVPFLPEDIRTFDLGAKSRLPMP